MADIIPRNQAAEESVLGSIIIDGDCVALLSRILKASDFFYDINADIYTAALNTYKRLEKINQITIGQELQRLGKLESCGGVAQLSHLISICPTSLDAEYYADIVRSLATDRKIIKVADEIKKLGEEQEPDTGKLFEKINKKLSDIHNSSVVSKSVITPMDAGNIVMDLVNEYNNPEYSMPTGYLDLDNICTGFYPGELTVIGSRPSLGKTQIMMDIAEALSKKHKVLFCSVEMSVKHILERKVSSGLQVSIRHLRREGLDDDGMTRVYELAGQISQSNISYLAQGTGSGDIYAEVSRLKKTTGVDIVFVDYLQFLKDCWEHGENQNVRTGRAMKSLKSIAVDFDVHVVVASQLNRALELRSTDNRRPNLSDLRDSGNIEQDADIVWLLYRSDDEPHLLEVKQAKHRQLGSAPAVKLLWNMKTHRYVDDRVGECQNAE